MKNLNENNQTTTTATDPEPIAPPAEPLTVTATCRDPKSGKLTTGNPAQPEKK